MSKKKEKLHILFEAQSLLVARIGSAENWGKNLIRISTECAEKIKKASNINHSDRKSSIISHYVKFWMRSYLGTMDECMVLITGQMVRDYFMKEHIKYIHERPTEESYYKLSASSVESMSLSFCSIDGIDFECRELSKIADTKMVCLLYI